MERFYRAARRVILPDGIILGGVLVAVTLLRVPEAFEPYTDAFGTAVVLVGLGVAVRFHRQRFLFGILALGLADLAFNHLAGPAAAPVAAAAAVLLPLNLAFLAILKSRGGGQTLVLAAVLGIQVVAVTATAWPVVAISPWRGEGLLAWSPSARPLAMAVAASAFVVALGLAVRWEPKRRSFFWAILAVPLAADATAAGEAATSTAVLVTAGVLLVMAALEDIRALAYGDALTGLPARRALTERLERLRGRYTLAMVDVDHFKAFNDRWGHAAGDQTLKLVAERLREVGGGGQPFRYGGEEFVVVFPDLDPLDARVHLDTVRQAVAARPFTVRQDSTPLLRSVEGTPRETVTVSIGVAGSGPSRTSPGDVLQAADRALYRAKQEGRNRVVAAPSAASRPAASTQARDLA